MAGTDTPVFTVSARGKYVWNPIMPYLAHHYSALPIETIESVFGFVDPCTLYGGRPYWFRQISDRDAAELNSRGIGVRIPITTHFVDRREFDRNRPVLEKYHKEGNSLILYNDTMVPWIREDFPKYRIEASMLKFLNTYDKIERALETFDTVVIPMDLTEEPDFLAKIPNKERVTLFGNAGCALTCPARMCYTRISRINKVLGSRNPLVRYGLGYAYGVLRIRCSQKKIRRQMRGVVDFDLRPLIKMGFRRFKMLRARSSGKTGF